MGVMSEIATKEGKKIKRRMKEKSLGQAAVEYLTTYGWAILIIAVVLILLYVFVISPYAVAPQRCIVSSGIYCNDIVFGSNAVASKVVFLLSNSQQYPLNNPGIMVNAQNQGNYTGACSPDFVLPGGSMICNVTIPKVYSQGSFVSGQVYIEGTPCISGTSPSTCSGSSQQTYSGSLTAHVQQPLSSTNVQITLTVQNSTQPANGGGDLLTASVKILGQAYAGATVGYSANQLFPSFSPTEATTNTNGNSYSYISSTTPGNVIVTADYAGYTANVPVQFTVPVYVTFEVLGIGSGSGPAVVINGEQYSVSQLPKTFSGSEGSRFSYGFIDPIPGSGGGEAANVVAFGCGTSGQNSTFLATYNCTVIGLYSFVVTTVSTSSTSTVSTSTTSASTTSTTLSTTSTSTTSSTTTVSGGSPSLTWGCSPSTGCSSICLSSNGGSSYPYCGGGTLSSPVGTPICIEQTTNTGGGYTFQGWSGYQPQSSSGPVCFSLGTGSTSETADYTTPTTTTTTTTVSATPTLTLECSPSNACFNGYPCTSGGGSCPLGYNIGGSWVYVPSGTTISVSSGTGVFLTEAGANTGSSFTGWTGSPEPTALYGTSWGSSSSTGIQFNMPSSPMTATAGYTGGPGYFCLYTPVSSSSGSVSVSPGGSSGCTSESGWISGLYNTGSSVTITATPAGGSSFSSWSTTHTVTSGSCSYPYSGDPANPSTVSCSNIQSGYQDTIYEGVNWGSSIPTTTTTTTTIGGSGTFCLYTQAGTGGSVSTSPTASQGSCSSPASGYTVQQFTSGTSVTVTATASSGYAFPGSWSGSDSVAGGSCSYTSSGTSNPITVSCSSVPYGDTDSIFESATFTYSPTTYTVSLNENIGVYGLYLACFGVQGGSTYCAGSTKGSSLGNGQQGISVNLPSGSIINYLCTYSQTPSGDGPSPFYPFGSWDIVGGSSSYSGSTNYCITGTTVATVTGNIEIHADYGTCTPVHTNTPSPSYVALGSPPTTVYATLTESVTGTGPFEYDWYIGCAGGSCPDATCPSTSSCNPYHVTPSTNSTSDSVPIDLNAPGTYDVWVNVYNCRLNNQWWSANYSGNAEVQYQSTTTVAPTTAYPHIWCQSGGSCPGGYNTEIIQSGDSGDCPGLGYASPGTVMCFDNSGPADGYGNAEIPCSSVQYTNPYNDCYYTP